MVVLVAVIALLVAAPAALAAPEDVACVGVERPDCTLTPDTLEDALLAAPGLVHLGPGPFEGDHTSAEPVELAGSEGTVLKGSLTLTGTTVSVHNVRVDGPFAAGPGTVTLHDADLGRVELTGAETIGRNLTVTGRTLLDGGTLTLSSSVLAPADPFALEGDATVTTAFSAHAEDADAQAPDRIDAPADPRAVATSKLVDAGDPAALAPFEPFEDASGAMRLADGNGDGTLRRDIGAYEVQPSPLPMPAASVLVNGGAEEGLAGWSGTFVAEPFGSAFLPSRRTGTVLAAGTRFFSGAGAATATLSQRIDVSRAAAAIDRGTARASLSGLLGGYGADPDALTVRAVFKDPENAELGAVALPAVTAEDRLNGTALLRRGATGVIPARTRAIDVMLGAERRAGAYTDAYADNLGLVLTVPGVPVDGGPDDPPVDGLKPFNGVAVLTAQPRFSRAGGARVLLACADATVGYCKGRLTLRAPKRIARFAPFSLRPGVSRHVVMRLRPGVLARLARAVTTPATLVAVAYDRQGLERRATIPVVLTTTAAPPR